jgi:CAAX prenyl protease-like protein
MLFGMFEPGPPKTPEPAVPGAKTTIGEVPPGVPDKDGIRRDADGHVIGPEDELDDDGYVQIPYRYYPRVYTIKIIATVAVLLLALPAYFVFPFRINPVAILVGVVGVVAWIGICKLNLEQKLLVPMGLGSVVSMGERPGFNPLEQIKDDPTWAYGFLAIRLFGLAILIPIIEEFFLRVFLVRFVMDVDWFKIPFGKVDRLGLITSIAFPILMHPGEIFAAAAWFGMITWLMLRTRNIWDCVAAHAVTNALLGAYVITTGEWQFM